MQLNIFDNSMTYVYVKALLRVMYRKYSARGGVKWQIQHDAKPSAVYICPYITSLTDLMFCLGRISSSSDGFEWMCISK